MAARRSGSTTTCASAPAASASSAPRRTAAMMSSGSSERGLSLVSTTTSAPRTAIAPIAGRFCWSRSPPHPMTRTSRPPFATSPRAVTSSRSSASGLCAKSTRASGPLLPAATRSIRPGTPVHDATPAAACSGSSPHCTRATTASAAFARLKSPASAVAQGSRTPSGPASTKLLPSGPSTTSSARQSAAPPDGETVTTGTPESPTSRRPYGSSTSITPSRDRSGVNRVALTAKYSSRSAWKSRWSWLRLVNTATSYVVPSTRPIASAWLDTSIATARTPSLAHHGEQGLQVRRLRGGPDARQHLVADPGLDGPHQPGGVAGRTQGRVEQVHRRGLAVGAGHADQRAGRAPARRRPRRPARRAPPAATARRTSAARRRSPGRRRPRRSGTATAPAAAAAAAKSAPCARDPAGAAYRSPGRTPRESRTTPVTTGSSRSRVPAPRTVARKSGSHLGQAARREPGRSQ